MAEIAEKLEITNSAVSQHLKVLKNVNIVKSKREGYKMFYEINNNSYCVNGNIHISNMYYSYYIYDNYLFCSI
jgi:DNA-binding transcriptional ArsR family regulator